MKNEEVLYLVLFSGLSIEICSLFVKLLDFLLEDLSVLFEGSFLDFIGFFKDKQVLFSVVELFFGIWVIIATLR